MFARVYAFFKKGIAQNYPKIPPEQPLFGSQNFQSEIAPLTLCAVGKQRPLAVTAQRSAASPSAQRRLQSQSALLADLRSFIVWNCFDREMVDNSHCLPSWFGHTLFYLGFLHRVFEFLELPNCALYLVMYLGIVQEATLGIFLPYSTFQNCWLGQLPYVGPRHFKTFGR